MNSCSASGYLADRLTVFIQVIMLSELDEFEAYIVGLAAAFGHADRDVALGDYTTGLLLPFERKSVESPRGIPRGVVLAAVGYGAVYGAGMKFPARLAELGLVFIVGVQPRANIWMSGEQPLPPKA